MELSVSELVDRLIVVNIKIYHLVDVIKGSANDADVAEAARKAQALNSQRSELKNEIDRKLGSALLNLDIKT